MAGCPQGCSQRRVIRLAQALVPNFGLNDQLAPKAPGELRYRWKLGLNQNTIYIAAATNHFYIRHCPYSLLGI